MHDKIYKWALYQGTFRREYQISFGKMGKKQLVRNKVYDCFLLFFFLGNFGEVMKYEMIKHSNLRSQDDQVLDFIIPCLINQSNNGYLRAETPLQKKRYSVQRKQTEPRANLSTQMIRVYKGSNIKISPQRQQRKEEQLAINIQQSGSKMLSKLEISLQKSPYILKNRFTKAHSLLHRLPTHFTPAQFNSFKKIPPKIKEEPSIPGIKFKTKAKQKIEDSYINSSQTKIQKTHSQLIHDDINVSNRLKNWKQKKEWDRKRSTNIDFIINKRCKNFMDLITEYKKRMNITEMYKIFIFNSRDGWLKKALLQRGWVQNHNKQSRAFHLYWSNKVYKQKAFPQQLTNHYPNSDLLTSKGGLHSMLLKYGLTKLQPKTFDITFQKNQFTQFYVKLEFIGSLKRFINKFIFSDEASYTDIEKIKLESNRIRLLFFKQESKNEEKLLRNLLDLLENCFYLIEGKTNMLSLGSINYLLNNIKSDLQLNPYQQQSVRLVRDLWAVSMQRNLFQKQLSDGLENVWLTKSKNSSKGVGISIHKNYEEIIKHQNRLAQKYIQNPLIFKQSYIKGRKFDIRVWVLLVGNSKPKLYYHQKFYGRFCYESYSLQTINLDNQKKHLTNYSQNKLKFKEQLAGESIILPQQIFKLIQIQRGIDFKKIFYEKIQAILSQTLIIFKHQIARDSQNSFQLFGLDLLIDQNLMLHLLEINLSAACEERHEGLSEMLSDLAHGMINILEGESDLKGWRLIKGKIKQ